MEEKNCIHLHLSFIIFAITVPFVLAVESGSGEGICNGDIQQPRNCTASEFVQRFYFNTTVQKCLEYTTCPIDTPQANVFDSKESCEQSCADNTEAESGCPDLPQIENGSSFKECYNGKCYGWFFCNSNYKLVGYSSFVMCQDNGQWPDSMPICVGISAHYKGAVVSDDTVTIPQSTANSQFECRLSPQTIPGDMQVDQQWILDPEPESTEKYYSEEKSAYILELAGTRNIKITCSIEVSTEDRGKMVTLTTTFQVKVLIEVEAPKPVHSPFNYSSSEMIMLRCAFSGNPKPKVSWHLNGDLVESELSNIHIMDHTDSSTDYTFSALIIETPTDSHYGTYTCNATNEVGESSQKMIVTAPARTSRSVSSKTSSQDLCSSTLQQQTATFKGRLTRKLTMPGDKSIYHLKIDAVLHANNFPSAQTGSVLRVASGPEELPSDIRRHQPAIFTIRTENRGIILDSYQPYSIETEKEIEQRCFK